MGDSEKEKVNRIKSEFPPGTRVELMGWGGPYYHILPGDRGFVSSVDDDGTIFVEWDSGWLCGLSYKRDKYRRISN